MSIVEIRCSFFCQENFIENSSLLAGKMVKCKK
nr:MAG TPA: hypothetical protein [Caudoviricetes sp.]